MKVKREGNQLTIWSDGKRTSRKFLTPEQAITAHEKLIEEHEKELVLRRSLRRDPRNPELEQVIMNAPEDAASYQIYADWLQSQSDPRGTLIALYLSLEADSTQAEVAKAIGRELTTHRAYFFGPLAIHRKNHVFEWRFGYIRRVDLSRVEDARAEDVLEQLLQHPSGRFLVDVCACEGSEQVVRVLERVAPPTLRSVHFARTPGLDLSRFWRAAPRLRNLSLADTQAQLGAIELPELESLRIDDHTVTPDAVSAIANASWQKLKVLSLIGGSTHDWIGELMPMLERHDLASLQELSIDEATNIGSIIEKLVAAPVAAQLMTLKLSNSDMTNAHAIELARHRDRFPRLAKLDVSRNALTSAGIAALRGFASEVDSWGQDLYRNT